MTRNPADAMDKARLAAFADGELSPEEAAVVVVHLADHPADQAYVDQIMLANAALVQAFSGPIGEPVPEPLRRAIFGADDADPPSAMPSNILAFRRFGTPLALAGMALAASVAVAAILLPQATGTGVTVGPLADGTELHAAVSSLPSGVPMTLTDGRALTILATLPMENGHCREIEIIDRTDRLLSMALACTDAAGWSVAVTLHEPLPEAVSETGFVPAGGLETAGISPWLDRLGAGMVLDAAAEAALIAGKWR